MHVDDALTERLSKCPVAAGQQTRTDSSETSEELAPGGAHGKVEVSHF
jgi:hypothetical protein